MSNNIMSVKFESELQIIAIKKMLESIYGCRIRPRGRHSNRKAVVRGWSPGTQNDVPWRVAERVTFYKLAK